MKNLKVFFISFLIICPLLWAINSIGIDTDSHNFSAAQVSLPLDQKMPEFCPELKEGTDILDLDAQSAISIWFDSMGKEKVLFEKKSSQQMPMASLTKLMTAVIVLEVYPYDNETEELLNIMLVQSNNEAAYSLADYVSQKKFVELMNAKAKNIGLNDTNFANASGVDNPNQYSTSSDLGKLAYYIFEQYPEIFKITSKEAYKGSQNTNELLGEISGIIGGKTGETPNAGQCLLLILEAPNERGYLINVILGSENRFVEMRAFIDWLFKFYAW